MGAFLITLRETFEASLIIGLILAFLKKTGALETHGRAVWQGAAAAVLVSAIAATILFATVGKLEGTAEILFEAVAMLTAAAVLTWMVFWMRRQAQTMGSDLRNEVTTAIAGGGTLALATVAFVAVVREGFETALFLFVSVGESGATATIIGGLIGCVVAVALGVGFYRGSLKLDLRRFFLVTGLLVLVLAAYLLYGGLAELAELIDVSAVEALVPVLTIAFLGGVGWAFLRNNTTVTNASKSAPPSPAAPPVS
jgi:high-affinity iron transporter